MNEFLTASVHQLKGGQDLGEMTLGLLVSLADLVIAFETEVGHIDCLGPRGAQDGDAGDNANCTFRADEQLLQIIACVVLSQGGEGVDDSAIRQDRFKTKHVAVKTAVTQQTESSRVGRDVPSDMARTLCTQIQGEQVVALRKVLIGYLEDNTRIDDQHTRGLIERANLVHA